MSTPKYHARSNRRRSALSKPASKPSARPGMPRYLRVPMPGSETRIGRPGDSYEQEADRAARQVISSSEAVAAASDHQAQSLPGAAPSKPSSGPAALFGHRGRPLDAETRGFMESRFGTDLGHVRVHTDSHAARLNHGLGSTAFTQGSDIFFGAGRAPGRDELTAHELAHVVQQGGGLPAASPLGTLTAAADGHPVQCSFTGSYLIPGSSDGVFEIDLQTREGALGTPPTQSGLDGYIRFVPVPGAPNSNVIAITQIVKLTDAGGTDVDPLSMPPAQAPRGGLGDPGLRTEDDPLTGVEGGYFTDVHHRSNAGSPGRPRGSTLLPRYNFQPAGPGVTGTAGQTQQPAQYGGGTGGVVGQTPGFKRSDDPADIRSAAMYDFPGTSSPTANLNFDFESAALGEDTGITYGAVSWGFNLRSGAVQGEYLDVSAGTSATFDEAIERHRDFYVHEPVTFYFDYNDDALSPTEAAKIDGFLDYLSRNTDVEMSIIGYADQVGGASLYNERLALRRGNSVQDAMLARGIDAARITGVTSVGASTAATTNAGTGDQGGDAALGADQSREANRWANRRVQVVFSHTVSFGP